ncbi:tyrosine-type recombinase/integrase [Vibrio chagasii]|nr:tyrosine-type recombinase/integrase [Vibrio chagasii]
MRKNISCHTLKGTHSLHLLQSGADIRTVQEQLGHTDLKTTRNLYSSSLERQWRCSSPYKNIREITINEIRIPNSEMTS